MTEIDLVANMKYQSACQHSWMGQRKGTLMINSAKSSSFCIPMVLGLSGSHVTCSGHFLADWRKLESKHRCFSVSRAVRDNHKQPQLCLAKLTPLFASILASRRSHWVKPGSLCSWPTAIHTSPPPHNKRMFLLLKISQYPWGDSV